jgi:hypothetical protein
MTTKKNLLMMKQPESMTAKLERIASHYRHDVEVAMYRVNKELENSLTELAEEFGFMAVYAAVETSEDDLIIDYGPYPSLYEAFDCVPEPESDEEVENA